MANLFEYRAADKNLHPNYLSLCNSPDHGSTRELMNGIHDRMGDPNGKFFRDFQRLGFHARVFELAAFAYLEEAGFTVDHTHEQPDFLVSNDSGTICLEATTSNPTVGRDRDISLLRLEPVGGEELYAKVYREFPRRVIASLSKKLRHQYQSLPQCAGRPLVVMIGPYFEPGSMTYTDEALVHSLYGVGESYGPRLPRTPFFSQPQSRSISAVLFTNQFTVPRFFRLSEPWPSRAGLTVYRSGLYYEDLGAEFAIREYQYRLDNTSAPTETWHQGVTVFRNPDAEVPLPAGTLPCTSEFSIKDGYLHRSVKGFHTVTSLMVIAKYN